MVMDISSHAIQTSQHSYEVEMRKSVGVNALPNANDPDFLVWATISTPY